MSYPGPFLDCYRRSPQLARSSFEEQQRAIYGGGFIYSNAFSAAMQCLGNEAHEILFDLEPLQRSWARDRGVQYSDQDWKTEILLAQLCQLKPDVVYFQATVPFPVGLWKSLKEIVPSIKVLIVYKGYPHDLESARGCDLFFVGVPSMLTATESAGLKARLLYHAFDEQVLEKFNGALTSKDLLYNFTFLGSSGFGYSAHKLRYWTLVDLIRRTDLQLWTHDPAVAGNCQLKKTVNLVFELDRELLEKIKEASKFFCDSFSIQIRGLVDAMLKSRSSANQARSFSNYGEAPSLPLAALFPDRCSPPAFGMQMYRILAASKATFNIHTDAANGSVGNMRMFEATGVGTCLVSDTGTNIQDLFEPDSEIVTYRSIDECIEKIQYLLQHDSRRVEIARAGQRRTLKDHTYFRRCEQINALIQEEL